jgi:UDP-glucose:tetrahydrobiopterin glucosyltransferase
MRYKLLIISTPVGPLGSGLGGGVELTVTNLVRILHQRGHAITVVAPETSTLPVDVALVNLPGQWQSTAQTAGRQTPVTQPEPSVLSAMWHYARQMQQAYDLIVHFSYDWLPFYLTPFFQTPIAHFVSMGSLNNGMDAVMGAVAHSHPGTIGVYTRIQAETFPESERYHPLGSAIDLSLYDYCPHPQPQLAWVGRISPEKALEDAIAAAEQSQFPLKIMGKLEDQTYWQALQNQYPQAPVEYLGFFDTQGLQAALGQCRALIMTPRWVEAFGNVAIEALACGVPVIAYQRGGPIEIVRHGETGWLVEPDSVAGLVEAIDRIDQIDRQACRHQAERDFSLPALGERFEQWFDQILAGHR